MLWGAIAAVGTAAVGLAVCLLALCAEHMRWASAPRWGPAAVRSVESIELQARLNQASSHAITTATAIIYVAAAVLLVVPSYLVVRAHRHAGWIPFGITLLAFFADWLFTANDLALLGGGPHGSP